MRPAAVILMGALVCALAATGIPVSANQEECRARLASELTKVQVPSYALDFYHQVMERVPPVQLKEIYPVRACEKLITDMDDALDAYKSKAGPCATLSAELDDQLLQEVQAEDEHVDELERVKLACWTFG